MSTLPQEIYMENLGAQGNDMKEMAHPASRIQKPIKVASAGFPILQRKCACGGNPGPSGECEECRKKRGGMLQRSALTAPPTSSAPPIVHDVLQSPGQPLDPNARAFMEPRFGHDFSKVRVHTDARAAESANAVNALAYTVGQNIVFGAGRYTPNSLAGQSLMAHELTHVVQQQGGPSLVRPYLAIGPTNDRFEQEADQVADTVVASQSKPIHTSRGIHPV